LYHILNRCHWLAHHSNFSLIMKALFLRAKREISTFELGFWIFDFDPLTFTLPSLWFPPIKGGKNQFPLSAVSRAIANCSNTSPSRKFLTASKPGSTFSRPNIDWEDLQECLQKCWSFILKIITVLMFSSDIITETVKTRRFLKTTS
jgi:hypothetical protein